MGARGHQCGRRWGGPHRLALKARVHHGLVHIHGGTDPPADIRQLTSRRSQRTRSMVNRNAIAVLSLTPGRIALSLPGVEVEAGNRLQRGTEGDLVLPPAAVRDNHPGQYGVHGEQSQIA